MPGDREAFADHSHKTARRYEASAISLGPQNLGAIEKCLCSPARCFHRDAENSRRPIRRNEELHRSWTNLQRLDHPDVNRRGEETARRALKGEICVSEALQPYTGAAIPTVSEEKGGLTRPDRVRTPQHDRVCTGCGDGQRQEEQSAESTSRKFPDSGIDVEALSS